jgi:hypothetical protein
MRLFFLVILLQGIGVHAQFSDDFSDGDFISNPEWKGDSACFILNGDPPALRLNAPAEAGAASLFTVSQSMEAASWQFAFRMGFNPSSANFARVYLAADGRDISQLNAAFYLELGTSDDNVSLWQIKEGQHELLIKGAEDRLNSASPEGEISVRRHVGGEMVLETKLGEDWQEEGRVKETAGFSSAWFGLSCHYTSTRSTLFWFNDFLVEGASFRDTVPSKVLRSEMLDARTVRIGFSREIMPETFDRHSFYWRDTGPAIDSVSWQDALTVYFHLSEDFPNGQLLEAGLQGVLGANGAPLVDSVFTLYFYKTQRYDLVFSEVMADPSSSLGLAGVPYLEVYNRSDQPISVSGFSLEVGYRQAVLGKGVIFPGDYLLLVPLGHAGAWSSVENKSEVADWPLLPVSGADLVLRDSYGDVVAAFHYSREMGQEGFKRDGGWSLEVKDLHNLSGHLSNWDYSIDPQGGTPGEPNSLFDDLPDVSAPHIESVFLKNDSCLVLQMTEPVNPAFLHELDDHWFAPDGLSVHSFRMTEPFHSGLEVCFTNRIPENRGYEVRFKHLPDDLAGNVLLSEGPVRFARPVAAHPFDVVINELLFDPPAEGSDFVELYNRSDKHIDLSELYLSRGNVAGTPEALVPISIERSALFPGEHLVLTGDKCWLTSYYKVPEERNVLSLAGMPNYPNAGGTVILSDKRALVIDAFSYNDALHYPLLGASKGVSLERMDPDAPTQKDFNWHSASADAGYATPGRKNSQVVSATEVLPDDFIHLAPDVFTPDQDGVNDLLLINYEFEKPGYSCSVNIYNRAGQLVRCLVNNELAGTNGFFSWDGLNEQNARCPTGIYVILVRCFHPSGGVKEAKKVTVLGL